MVERINEAPEIEGYSVITAPPSITRPIDYVTTVKGISILVAGIALFFIAELLAPIGLASRISETGFFGFPTGYPEYIPSILALVLALVLIKYPHEYLHRWVGEAFGYSPTVEYGLLGGKTTFEEELVDRRHQIVILLAPILVLTPATLALATATEQVVVQQFFSFAFIITTAGSCADLIDAAEALSHEGGARYWHTTSGDEPLTHRYVPEE